MTFGCRRRNKVIIMYMSLKFTVNICIIILCSSLSLCYSEHRYIQNPHQHQVEVNAESVSAPKPGWVDPFDMLGESHSRDSLFVQSDVQINLLQKRCSNYDVYMRRFVNMFLHAVELRDTAVSEDSLNLIKLEFLIGGTDIKILKEFGKGGDNVPKIEVVSDIFSKIFSQKTPQDTSVFGFLKVLTWFQKALLKVISSPEWTVLSGVGMLMFVTLWLIYKTHSYRLAIFTILLTVFLAGFGFNWIRMYEEKEVERYVHITMHGAVPKHCSSQSQSMAWYEHMYYRMFGVDCQEFYKSRDVRPIVKISPTDVLAETLSSMIVKPAEHLGKAYGHFIISVTDNSPWWLKPLALPISFMIPVLVMVILLAFLFNYRLSFSITGFHIIPSWCHTTQGEVRNNSRYIEDCSRKVTNDPSQKNTVLNSLITDSDSPLFLMNWKGLKKLSSSTLLGEKSEEEKINDPKGNEEEGKQSVEEENELMIEDLKEFEKFVESVEKQQKIEERKKRSIHTCSEGESSLTNISDQSTLMIQYNDMSSGDRSRTSPISKRKNFKDKTS